MLDSSKLDYDFFGDENGIEGIFSLFYADTELCIIFLKLNMEEDFKEIVTQFNGEMHHYVDMFYEEEDIEECLSFFQEYLETEEFKDKFVNRIMDLYEENNFDIDELKKYLFMFSKNYLLDIIKEQSQ